MTKSWVDLDVDGRRAERIIKLCETQIVQQLEQKNYDLVLAFMDRFAKTSNYKLSVQDLVIGFKQLRRLAEKEYSKELTHEKLVELR